MPSKDPDPNLDPLLAQYQRGVGAFDPWRREAEVNEHIVVIGGDEPVVEDSRQVRARPSVIVRRGKPEGGEA